MFQRGKKMIGGEYVRDQRSPEELYGLTGQDLEEFLASSVITSEDSGQATSTIDPANTLSLSGIRAVIELEQPEI